MLYLMFFVFDIQNCWDIRMLMTLFQYIHKKWNVHLNQESTTSYLKTTESIARQHFCYSYRIFLVILSIQMCLYRKIKEMIVNHLNILHNSLNLLLPVTHIYVNFSLCLWYAVSEGVNRWPEGSELCSYAATYLYNLIAMWRKVWCCVSSGKETTLSIGRVLSISPPPLVDKVFLTRYGYLIPSFYSVSIFASLLIFSQVDRERFVDGSDDLTTDTTITYNEFVRQYKELSDWLGNIQQQVVQRQTISLSEKYLNQVRHWFDSYIDSLF